MNSTNPIWPVDGYSDAALRKRLAYFRPCIEDRRVDVSNAPKAVQAYAKELASELSNDGADFTWHPAGKPPKGAKSWRQSEVWPFEIVEDPQGDWSTSVSSGLVPIEHPRVGIAVPTHSHPRAALEACAAIAAEYPGYVRFAIVANGVDAKGLRALRAAETASSGLLTIVALDENMGYGQGANAGLAALAEDPTLSFIGVMNDDVLPGTDCLFEMVNAFAELDRLGHRPGAIGPVSNEINGGQRVDFSPVSDAAEMREQADQYWKSHHSSASQTLQLRGLFMLLSRECLEAVGGFDPRFGIGNFEDDDHNVRTRLAGFTLWVASGAFLFHHGSSTFRSLKVDYESNIRRNMEAMVRKWQLDRLDDWLDLAEAPEGVDLYQPLEARFDAAHRIRINGESVDLIHQASDIEFAAWIMNQPQVRTPEGRKALLETLQAA